MDTKSTTYTMLVTIAHDDGAAPSLDLLEVMVQRALEEGVREFSGVYAATASAFAGDRVSNGGLQPIPLTDRGGNRVAKAKRLHAVMRA